MIHPVLWEVSRSGNSETKALVYICYYGKCMLDLLSKNSFTGDSADTEEDGRS